MRNLLFVIITILLVSCDKNVDNIKTPLIVNSKLTGDLQSGAIELFKQSVLTEDAYKNVIISPLSIQYAIGMAANGASGVTLDELMKVLGAPSEQLKDVNANLKAITSNIIGESKNYKIGISNAVFFDASKFQMNDNYKGVLTDAYQSKLQQLNFKEVDNSLKEINSWVSEKTNGRIPKVLDNIQDDEFMFLINALYMKATWDQPFDDRATYAAEFKDSKNAVHPMQLMNQRADIAYYKSDAEKTIVMPMAGGKLEAVFILPEQLGVIDYISQMSTAGVTKMTENAVKRDLMIGLPKMELLMKYDLKNILQDMNIKTAFGEQADFTKMGTATNQIILTRALHDVFMKMDESGMEGAAVTTIGVGVTSLPEYVGFDRPFVMLVYEKATGAYLFMGKVEKP